MLPEIITLPNGLQIIYQHVPYTRAVHCGFIIESGSRDDKSEQWGMSHFVEHMIFKGTARRKTFHIVNYLEAVGGELDAYTTKEKTYLHASLVSEYFDRAVELLTDITFHSIFPEKEIVKEKQVIFEEIDMYRGIPDEAIEEDFDLMMFPEHGLGHPILGTKDSIQQFTQQQLLDHIRSSFTSDRIVFGVIGNVTRKEVDRVAAKYLAHLPLTTGKAIRKQPLLPQLDRRVVEGDHEQAHVLLGGRASSVCDDRHFSFLVLNNLLGGPAMNSRLTLNIREKYGLAYNIQSFYRPYSDTGMWGVYYACENGSVERIRKLVMRELKDLRENPLGSVRLNQVKRQLIGQLTLGNEHLLNQMLGMASDMLTFERVRHHQEFVDDIESLSAKDLQDAADDMFFQRAITDIIYRKAG
ncbi:MAG: insulinase family protein [Bacteroidia bacterium]|nr:insulinase family protein [Bacteroidia bacterium]